MNNEELHIQFRFPLFRNEKWDLHKLSEIAEYTNGRAHEQDIETNGKYIVVNSKYISTDGEVVKYSNIANCLAEKNDILMVLSDVPNGRAIAKCYLVKEDNKYTINQRICKITPKQGIESSLLYYLMNRNPYFLSFDDGVKQTNLRNDDVLNFEILLPTNPSEQQKIAACLSSLDDVIAGHEEKLTLLEEHKKGLMQNLFPQEGETQPKYRFPEFENDGDWVEKKLSEIGVLVNGLTYSPNDVSTEGILVLRSSNVQNSTISLEDNVYVNKTINEVNPIKLGDILICVRNGSKSLIGKNALIRKDMPNTTHGAFMTVFRSQQFEFVYQLFQSDLFFKQVHTDLGATINSINGRNLLNYKFVIPKNPLEQQKIASVLSSVDELIVAQRKKIEALKVHKKGLMQGLFPKIES